MLCCRLVVSAAAVSLGLELAHIVFACFCSQAVLLGVQVDLTRSSIRPALGHAEMTVMQQRLIQMVEASTADIVVHVSSWEHDSEQGALLPQDKISMHVYSFADHRLAFYLDEINQLELLLKDTIMVEQGFKDPAVALAT